MAIESKTHESGIAAAEAVVAEYGVQWAEIRSFAAEHLIQRHPDLEEIGSSDVSIEVAYLGNFEPNLLREECKRLAERDEIVNRVAAESGKTYEETLAGFRALLAPLDD